MFSQTGFLPAFEKVGKICHLFLTPDYAILLHNVLNSNGVQAVAQFKKVRERNENLACKICYVCQEYLFHGYEHVSDKNIIQDVLFEDYRISSQNEDKIAFTIDLNLLAKALRSSISMDGDKLQVKLVKKRAVAAECPMPFLSFESMVCIGDTTRC